MFVKSIKTKVIIIKGRNIMPGTTFIPDDEAQAITEHQMFKALERKGDFIIQKNLKAAKSAKDSKGSGATTFLEEIGGMSAKMAVTVLKDNFNRTDLEAVIENDDRATVIAAAEKQLDKLEIGGSDNEDDEGEI